MASWNYNGMAPSGSYGTSTCVYAHKSGDLGTPFTNLHSEDIVRKEQIVFFNFKLNKADKLPQEIAEKTLEKFRTLEDGLADGNRTTESPPDAQ